MTRVRDGGGGGATGAGRLVILHLDTDDVL